MSTNLSLHIATPRDAARLNNRLVEAARYALLRRLAPAIRHDIAGALQPLGMVAKILDKRLQQAQLDVAALVKSSATIGALAGEATAVSMSLLSWLAPRDGEKLSAAGGVHEVLKLITTDLMLRGFAIDVAAPPISAELEASALRQVFSACLIALSDGAQAPARISVTLEESAEGVLILLRMQPEAGEDSEMAMQPYRALEWDEVQLLASAEGVKLHRLVDGADLRFALLKDAR